MIALLIVVLVVPLDKLAAGNASVQVATTVSGTVVMLARLVFAHFKS